MSQIYSQDHCSDTVVWGKQVWVSMCSHIHRDRNLFPQQNQAL